MTPPVSSSPIELLRHHQARIRRLAHRLAGRDAVDDLEQEVYVAALERPPRALAALPAWIATTLRNLAAKRLRSRSRREAREQGAATPEPVPASDELVARVELEEYVLHCVRELPEPERAVVILRFFEERSAAEIAGALGLGESTVRARLQRGIERLREQLDRRAGDREKWQRALAPWIFAAPTAAPVAAIAVVALAAAAGILVLVRSPPMPAAFAAPSRVAASAAGLEDAASSDSSTPARARVVVEEAVPLERTVAAAAPGRLKFRVVDAATGGALDDGLRLGDFEVRCISERRFATARRGTTDEFDLSLPSGGWDLAILHDGYEPELRMNLVVPVSATLDLGTIALVRGTSVVEGRLHRESLDPGSPHYVELRGAGRSPCSARCPLRAADEPCCGWHWDRSVLPVAVDGRFRFAGLAAGTYFLRPLDQTARPQPTHRLELARGEWKTFDLTIAAPVTIALELVDEAGQPFVGAWASAYEERPHNFVFELNLDDVAMSIQAGPDPADVRARIGLPPRFGQPRGDDELEFVEGMSGTAIGTGVGHSGFVERARAVDDTLLPPVPTPGFAAIELGIGRTDPNHYFLRELPPVPLRVRARCGDFAADELDLDLADPHQHSIRLVFRPPQR